jgi:diguanylate cyclase (GGDEF)-like protein/PAS domain S-box-containing protein
VCKSDTALVLAVDDATTRLLGWPAQEMVGKTSLELIHPDDQQLAVENWMQMLASAGPPRAIVVRHLHRDGSWVWVELTNHNHLDDPELSCVVAEMVASDPAPRLGRPGRSGAQAQDDGGDREAAPRRVVEWLAEREYLLHRLAEALPLGVIQLDAHGRVVYTNRVLHEILGVPRAHTFVEQLAPVVAEERTLVEEAVAAVLDDGLDNSIEVHIAAGRSGADKELRQCVLTMRSLAGPGDSLSGALVCVLDVTDSVRVREELRRRATYDEVTQCHNRTAVMELLAGELAPSRAGRPVALVYIDLDHFKEVNDRFGHAAGDELLSIVGRRLLGAVRHADTVGRIGGDEFLLVCPGMGSAAQAMRAAARVAAVFDEPVHLGAGTVRCRASIGVAWSGAAHADADTLVGWADAAMYEAKRTGSRRPVLHQPASAPAGPGR